MEELYRSLYTKYAMGLSEDEINNRVQYALQQDPSEFINAFYKKYTGGGPSADQVNYINSIISQPQQPQTIPDINFEDKEEKQEDINWFDQTWFGRGFRGASTTGESSNLMYSDFSNISDESIQDFIQAKKDEATNYVPSPAMQKFQQQYTKEGKTWAAWWRGVKSQPELLPELLVQSLGTQIGTLYDAPVTATSKALAGAGLGGVAGAKLAGYGAIPGAVAGAIGGLTTAMEAALTFGELIEAELEKEGKDFTDENIRDLLEGPKGVLIRNRSIGRGLTIGAVEGFTGGIAGKAGLAARKTVGGTVRGVAAAGVTGAGVEAVGGGTGEVLGRVVADQEMDPSEIGFEAVTGTVTTPINVGAALATAKPPTYSLNGETITYDKMKNFIDTAEDIDVAKANIQMRNDFTGIGKKAKAKQDAAIKAITDVGDKKKIAEVAKAQRENQIFTIAFAEEGGKVIGKEVLTVDNDTKAQSAYNRIAKEIKLKPKNVKGADGFIIGDYIVINKDIAGKTGQINVGAHEILHGVLEKHYQSLNLNERKKFISDFTSTISKESKDYIQNIIEQRNKEGESLDLGTTQEWLTIYSDGITKEEITFNESIATKIKNFLQNIFRKFGYNKEFATGLDTYNFMRDYQKSITEGKLRQRAIDVAGGGATVQELTLSKTASDNVQNIYEQQGTAGAFDIIQEFKPIVGRLVEKRRQAPKFDRALLTEEIETGERGIIDLINEYKPESGVPLAAYINKFLPSRAIEASRRVLGEEFTTDIAEVKDIAAEEVTTPEVTKKPKARKINPIDLVDDVKLKEKYTKDVQEKLKDLDPSKLTFKNLKDLSTTNTAKIFNVPVKKVTDPAANLTKQEKENALTFIRKNALDLIDLLPEGAITESASENLLGTSTGVPKSLLNRFYTKQDRITKGAGLSPYTKNKNISKKDFLEAFGVIEGRKSTDFGPRTPEAQAVKSMMSLYGKLATNSIVREELIKSGELQSVIENIAAGKSTIQFSKTVRGQFDLKLKGRVKADTLLTEKGLDKTLNLKEEIKTPEGIQRIVKTYKDNVVVLGPKEMWIGPRGGNVFTTSGKDYGITGNVTQKQRQSLKDLRSAINSMLNDPATKFGPPIKGVDNYTLSSYGTIFKGNTKDIKTKSKKFNKKISLIHKALWTRINKQISNNKESASGIATYLKLTANHTGHWHKLGAQIIGYSPNIKGTKYEYEHAMPATAAYLYLLDAALTEGRPFDKSYKLVMDNYKLIALDNADNKKLGLGKLARTMPDGWDIINNKWWERYFNKTIGNIEGGIDPNSIIDIITGKTFGEVLNIDNFGNSINNDLNTSKQKTRQQIKEVLDSTFKQPENITQTELLDKSKVYDDAIAFSRSTNPEKGISVFDFDDTLARTQSKVIVTMPDGKETRINATEFAKKSVELQEQGAKFNFEEFKKVIKGKKGPFFELAQKIKGKFGNKDIFILTARPQEAANAIHVFLKGSGLNIRQDNIIGLEDGRPEAKAEWILGKVNEGYNNFLFADDAYKNVKAVQDVLNEVDVKSDVQQARIQFSKNLNKEFNNMLSDTKGINPNAVFSDAAARVRGAKADKFWKRIFIPPSAEDFLGLMYHFVGKGKKGDQHLAFIKKALIDPFARGFRDINAAKQRLGNDYNELNKSYPSVKKKLLKATDYNNFTFDAAVRVYLWDKNGIDIPGISKRDLKALTDIVKNDNELKSYADQLGVITKQTDGYTKADENWVGGTIQTDLNDINTKVNRSQYLAEWIENKNKIFDKDTLNKIEALYGTSFKEALNDILYRMENGTNRTFGQNKLVNEFTDWINNSVGTIMFLNARSAVLQTISFVNFINWTDNNPLKVAQTILNFPQFAKDFAMIFNSDMLKQRRKGLQTDVSASEIVNQAVTSKNKVKAMISHLLKKGFVLTQIADSFAISLGGASFYRNRYDTYRKQGLSDKEAKDKAFGDFQETSEVSQQSARPDLISEQQAGPLGRLILAFQNTPMQYTRLIKKAALDLANNRGDRKTNISKILYYGAVQNFIFTALQSALFALMFSDEEEEKEKERYANLVNNMADTILRGTGVYGAALSTIKNVALEFIKQEKKGWRADHAYTMLDAINISPPIGSKARKIYGATQTMKFNRDEIKEKGFSLDNPAYEAVGNVVSATVNVPLDRAIRITNNTKEALNKNNEAWQRIALLLGWNTWDLGIQKDKVKEKKKKKNKKKQIIFW